MQDNGYLPKVRTIRNYTPVSRGSKFAILSYQRLSSLLKIITLIGISIVIYYIYISFKITSNDSKKSADSISGKLVDKHDKSKYEIKILNSTFKGLNDNLDPYQINTAQAIRTLDNNYLLEVINAKYAINSDEELVINAKNGILNEATQILKLHNNVQFFLGESTLNTQEAELNLLNKETSSNAGVLLFYRNCKLKANNFKSIDNNNIINFHGKVSTIIDTSDF